MNGHADAAMTYMQATGSHAWHRRAAPKAKWRVLDWLLSAHIHLMSATPVLRELEDQRAGQRDPPFRPFMCSHCRRRLTWRRQLQTAFLASGGRLTES